MGAFEFTQSGRPNELMVLTESCYVSYNANPCANLGVFRADNHGDETALCIDGTFFILNGDFRDEFTKAANEDVAKVVDVFETNKSALSTWSSDTNPIDFIAARLKELIPND